MTNISYIDTDAGIAAILSNFNTDYINHVVDDSLMMRFRPYEDEMPNFPDLLERQFVGVYSYAPDYTNEVSNVRLETYREIINKICKYYNLQFTGDLDSMDPLHVYGLTRTLYEIFISRFTQNMINFFVSYVVINSDSIYDYLIKSPDSKKPKEIIGYDSSSYIDPKYLIIHANINSVIYNMASYDIPLDQLLAIITNQETAITLSNNLIDLGDIYKNYYASFILDPKTKADMLTCIKLALQAKTQEVTKL